MLLVADLRASRHGPHVERLSLLLGKSRASIRDHSTGAKLGRNQMNTELSAEQRARLDAMKQLFAKWMAEDPEYDRQTWAELERGLREDPFTLRTSFDE